MDSKLDTSTIIADSTNKVQAENCTCSYCRARASAKGTAGMAMAVLVFN